MSEPTQAAAILGGQFQQLAARLGQAMAHRAKLVRSRDQADAQADGFAGQVAQQDVLIDALTAELVALDDAVPHAAAVEHKVSEEARKAADELRSLRALMKGEPIEPIDSPPEAPPPLPPHLR